MSTIKNLTIDQGSVFYANLQYMDNGKNPISLSGYTLNSQIRKSYYSANAASFGVTVLDSANGQFQLSFTSTETGLIKPGRYVYDVEATSGSNSIRIFEGEVTVTPGVTGNTYGTIFVSTEAIRGPQGIAGTSNSLVNNNYTVFLDENGTTIFPGSLPNSDVTHISPSTVTLGTTNSNAPNLYTTAYQTYNYWNAAVADDTSLEHSAFAGITASMPDSLNTPVVYIDTQKGNDGINHRWTFNEIGDLNLPNGGNIKISLGGVDLVAAPGNGQYVEMADAEGNTYIWIQGEAASIGTNWSTASKQWNFNKDGSVTFPYQQTNGRTGSGSAVVFPNNETQKIIATQNGVDTYPTVDRLVIAGGDGWGTGEGGDIYLWAGRSSYDAAGGGTGGDIKIDGGEAYDGEGGTIKIRGGSSQIGNNNIARNGGFVEIDAGSSWNGGNGADIALTAGYAYNGGTAGKITLRTNNGYWTFNNDGTTSLPNSTLRSPINYPINLAVETNSADENYVNVNTQSIDIYAFNSNSYSWSEVYLDNGNINDPYAEIIVKPANASQKTWVFDSHGDLTLPKDLVLPADGKILFPSNTITQVTTVSQVPEQSLSLQTSSLVPVGGALQFDRSTNGYLSTDISVNFGTSAWTVEAWIYPEDSGQNHILGVGTTPGINIYFGNYGGDKLLTVQAEYGAATQWVISYNENQWNHFAISFDGTYMDVWVNGVESTTGQQTYTGDLGNNILSIGALPWVPYLGNAMKLTQLRIVIGEFVYEPGASTIIVPTSQLTTVSGTQLLLKANTSATAFVDSRDYFDINITSGTVTWVSASPQSEPVAHNLTFDSHGDLTLPRDLILPTDGKIIFPANVLQLTDHGKIIFNNSNPNQYIEGSMGLHIHASDSVKIETSPGIPSTVASISYSTGSWEANPASDLATTGGTGTGLTVDVSQDGGYASTIAIHTAGSGYTDGDTITVTSGSSSATFTITVPAYSWGFDNDGTITFPDNTIQTTAYRANLSTATPTEGASDFTTPPVSALDLTKQVQKLGPGHYTLADGAEGQIMYFVPTAGSNANQVYLQFDHARAFLYDGTLYTNSPWFVNLFQNNQGTSGAFPYQTLVTAIFTDGAWQMSGMNSSWD